MTEKIKKGDFVELDYTGILKDSNRIFDTTLESVAKKEGIFDPKMTYAPVSICIGQGQILQGLDDAIEGVEVGKEATVTLPPEKAFGKKEGSLMKLVPTSAFRKQGIQLYPGLQVNVDGMVGTVRTVTGGRSIVDFNHPFSGKEITYKVSVKRLLTDDKEKVLALLELALNQKKESIDVRIENGKASVGLHKKFPAELLDLLKKRITEVLPQIKEVEFKVEEKKVEEKKDGNKQPAK